MKVKLSVNQQAYSGYLNVDPAPKVEAGKDFKIATVDFRNLDGLVEDAECREILAPDVLDYVHADNMAETIGNWVRKLRHGGEIIVGGTDPEEVSKLYLNGEITTLDFNHLLHGTNGHPWEARQGQITLDELSEILASHGLRILTKTIDGFKMQIRARRD